MQHRRRSVALDKALDKALRKLTSKGHPLHVVYEAGPCGFVIWRHLTGAQTPPGQHDQHSPRVSPIIATRQDQLPKEITDMAWKAPTHSCG